MSAKCQGMAWNWLGKKRRCLRLATIDGRWCFEHNPERRAKAKLAQETRLTGDLQERECASARQRALLDGMRAIADLRDNYDGDPLNQWQSKAFAALAAFLAAGGKLDE